MPDTLDHRTVTRISAILDRARERISGSFPPGTTTVGILSEIDEVQRLLLGDEPTDERDN